MKRVGFYLGLFLFGNQAIAAVLPNIGKVYEIIEEDVIEVMEHKLQKLAKSGELTKINEKFKQDVVRSIEAPKEIVGIKHTVIPKKFYYDPTVTSPMDLRDLSGRIFHHKGDRVNPLDTVSLMSNLVFIDGTNQAEIKWALNEETLHQNPLMIILVKGKPIELMKKLQRIIYFDQYGQITKKLGITQVPARVTQQGNKLLIEELKVD